MGLIVFGQLYRYATIYLSGPQAISRVKSAWPLEYASEYDVGLLNIGQTYPFDSLGVEPAPFRSIPTITYEYIIKSADGLSDALSFKDLRNKWNAIYARLQGRYTWTRANSVQVDNVSGQKGDLIVRDEDPSVGTYYRATARILKPAPFKLEKGQPALLTVELSFAILSDFEPTVSI